MTAEEVLHGTAFTPSDIEIEWYDREGRIIRFDRLDFTKVEAGGMAVQAVTKVKPEVETEVDIPVSENLVPELGGQAMAHSIEPRPAPQLEEQLLAA